MKHTLLTVAEVATALSAGKSTIWRWAQAGIIPKPVKIGGATRWLSTDIEAHITRLQDSTHDIAGRA